MTEKCFLDIQVVGGSWKVPLGLTLLVQIDGEAVGRIVIGLYGKVIA